MRVLLDECVPRPLRCELPDHQVQTVVELGWSGKRNSELLGLIASENFAVFLTVDQNLRYQQNLRANNLVYCLMNGVTYNGLVRNRFGHPSFPRKRESRDYSSNGPLVHGEAPLGPRLRGDDELSSKLFARHYTSNRLRDLTPLMPAVRTLLVTIQPGDLIQVGA